MKKLLQKSKRVEKKEYKKHAERGDIRKVKYQKEKTFRDLSYEEMITFLQDQEISLPPMNDDKDDLYKLQYDYAVDSLRVLLGDDTLFNELISTDDIYLHMIRTQCTVDEIRPWVLRSLVKRFFPTEKHPFYGSQVFPYAATGPRVVIDRKRDCVVLTVQKYEKEINETFAWNAPFFYERGVQVNTWYDDSTTANDLSINPTVAPIAEELGIVWAHLDSLNSLFTPKTPDEWTEIRQEETVKEILGQMGFPFGFVCITKVDQFNYTVEEILQVTGKLDEGKIELSSHQPELPATAVTVEGTLSIWDFSMPFRLSYISPKRPSAHKDFVRFQLALVNGEISLVGTTHVVASGNYYTEYPLTIKVSKEPFSSTFTPINNHVFHLKREEYLYRSFPEVVEEAITTHASRDLDPTTSVWSWVF